MNEFLQAIASRVKSPIFAYFTFFFFTLHWDHIVFLLLSDDMVSYRIAQMQEGVSVVSVGLAIGFAAVAAVVYPWITTFFTGINQHAVNRRNEIYASVESRRIATEENLKRQRAASDSALVVGIARDEESLEDIEDEEAREKARDRLDKIAEDALTKKPSEYVKNLQGLGLFEGSYPKGEAPPSRLDSSQLRENISRITSAVEGLGYSYTEFTVSFDQMQDVYKVEFTSITVLRHGTMKIEREIAAKTNIHPAFLRITAPVP